MDVTYNFTAGTRAVAQQVNQNFADVKSAVDVLETDVAELQNGVVKVDGSADFTRLQSYKTYTVSNATNATPIVITAVGHGFLTGDKIYISGVGGNTAANGVFTITKIGTDTFSLDGSVGNGTFTTNGSAIIVPNADNNIASVAFVKDYSFVPANTIIYVATTGSDTTGDGTSLKPFATLQNALNYFNGKTLLGAVTIQLADGAYTSTSRINIKHPQQGLITIQGNSSNRASVILNFTNVSGIYVDYGYTGVVIIKDLTINGTDYSTTIGISVAGILNINNCVIQNFNEGVISSGRAYISQSLITSNVTNNIIAFQLGYLYIETSYLTYSNYGAVVHTGGCLGIGPTTYITNNNAWGIYADTQGLIRCIGQSTVYINTNTSGAMLAGAGSTILAQYVSYSGTVSPAVNVIGNNNSIIIV